MQQAQLDELEPLRSRVSVARYEAAHEILRVRADMQLEINLLK